MANLRLKQVFGRWSDDNKVKAFNAIADDDLKLMLASDKEKAFETFKNKLGEEEFNAAFNSYYQTIKPAKKESSKKESSKAEIIKKNVIDEIDSFVSVMTKEEIEETIDLLTAKKNELIEKEVKEMYLKQFELLSIEEMKRLLGK